jgi:predicted DNA-binding protein (MmcQ/YjbR family)
MKQEEFVKYGLTKKGAIESFQEEWGANRLLVENKMFAMIGGDKEGKEIFTMKCEPELAEVYRNQYKDVVAGYYMNKMHWNSVYVDGVVPDDVIKEMLDMSYELILQSLPKKVQDKYL